MVMQTASQQVSRTEICLENASECAFCVDHIHQCNAVAEKITNWSSVTSVNIGQIFCRNTAGGIGNVQIHGY